MNDPVPDISWRGVAVTLSNMIGVAMRGAGQFECRTCGRAPCQSPGFCRLCRAADRKATTAKSEIEQLRALMDDRLSLDRTYTTINNNHGGAGAATVEALLFGLRERGIAPLKEPGLRARLAQVSNDQIVEAAERLQRLKPQIAQAWNDDQIDKLFEARKSCTKETISKRS
jgi:hypothetical protein